MSDVGPIRDYSDDDEPAPSRPAAVLSRSISSGENPPQQLHREPQRTPKLVSKPTNNNNNPARSPPPQGRAAQTIVRPVQVHHRQQHPASDTEAARATNELERLLVDKVTECHVKEDEVLDLRRQLRDLQLDLDERSDFCGRLKSQLGLLQESLRIERGARESTERDLEAFKKERAPDAAALAAVARELALFKGVGGISVGNNTVKGLSDEVGGLVRALMTLQLDLIRTFGWSAAALQEQWLYARRATLDHEATERRRMLCDFEAATRQCVIVNHETVLRERIQNRLRLHDARVTVSGAMLSQFERTCCRGVLELSAKHFAEWSTVSALNAEATRKIAATKLRHATALTKKVREASDEKAAQLEEERRRVNLLRARFDATRRERAAEPSVPSTLSPASDPLAKRAASARVRRSADPSSADSSFAVASAAADAGTATLTTANNSSRINSSQNNASADGSRSSLATPRGDSDQPQQQQQQQEHQGGPSRILRPHEAPTTTSRAKWLFPNQTVAAVAVAVSPRREHSLQRKQAVKSPREQDAHTQQQQQQQHQQQQQLAAQTKRIEYLSKEIESLHFGIGALQEAMRRKDDVLMRTRVERDALESECESVAAQCRLLEQACRFGAKKLVERCTGL